MMNSEKKDEPNSSTTSIETKKEHSNKLSSSSANSSSNTSPLTFRKEGDISESPFAFQVAGHGALLKLSESKICKPLIPIELEFYDSLKKCTSTLIPFTAAYYGTIDFDFTQEQLDEWNRKVKEIEEEQLDEDKKHSFSVNHEHLNPWSAKVTKLILNKIVSSGVFSLKYLVLEDLTSKFHHPSICDIKLGTRQHGDDASADKRLRHMQKCATTTSLPLGIRICGQLVYQPELGSYRHSDKYMGRKLTPETIQPSIAQFFNNGSTFRIEVLNKLILKLHELYRAVENEQHYRFYSTSLLLIYEGDFETNQEKDNSSVDLRMIDFAHTFSYVEGDVQDDGYLFGLKNFINLMENIQRDHISGNNSNQKRE